MEVEKVFHMNGGVDETSYARNSSLQKGASDMAKHIIMETLQEVYLNKNPESLGIADLGCSSGHNSLAIIKEMVDNIEKTCHKLSKPVPEFRINLNDLITNDFNVLFLALPDFHKDLRNEKNDGAPFICMAAYPGSFYGRLFPEKSLHFVHTSYSLHWLSRVPQGIFDEQGRSINKTAILISESSPPQVSEAYYKQFQEDMSLFLRSRAEEVVDGGKMVLIFMGRIGANHVDRGNYLLYELLSRSFAILVSQGEVEAEKLESYNMHFYTPSKEEIENEVRKEGSFERKRLEMLVVQHKTLPEGMSYGKAIASTARAINESAIKRHFGDKIIDNLFEQYARLLDEEKSKGEIDEIVAVVVLEKKIDSKTTKQSTIF